MGATRPTIVVIDDSADVRALVKTQLRLSGVLDVVADGADGTEAIGLAYRHQPALLLLDLSMPAMDGLDALAGILTLSPHTRIVVYSGFDEQGLADRALELGASAFIEKSTPIEQLAGRLIDVLTAEPRARITTAVGHPPDSPPRTLTEREVLDEHLERFHEVFDEAAIGMATMTLTGGIVRANRALGQLLQRPTAELVGGDYAALTGARSELVSTALADIAEQGVDLVHVEHDVVGVPGRKVLGTLAPVRDSRRQPLYVFLQLQDVTAQRAAEDELRQSEERFRLLVDSVDDHSMFMLSPEGVVTSWNAGARRTNGYAADEIIGHHFRTFSTEQQQRARHPEYELELALRDGRYGDEGWRIRKDGSTYWATVVITAVFDATGRHVGFATVTRDTTTHREWEERLRQSEERFRLLVEAVRDYAIFMLDPEGHIMSWNTGAQRAKGYSATEIIGQHFRVFYPSDLQAARHPEHELELALRDGSYAEEGWRIRKDGSRFWADVLITAVFNETGEHIGFAKVTRDITQQRLDAQERSRAAADAIAANESLVTLNAELQQAADDQSQFLAVTAHELRTPVAVLRGTVDTLARHWPELGEDERSGLIDGMSMSAERMTRLLEDLLTASRLDARALSLELTGTSLADVVTSAVARVHATDPDAEIEVDARIDPEVLADRHRLGQAVDNLLGNALRHGAPPAHVEIGATPEHGWLRITDAGEGVDAAVSDRLFERFATGNEVTGTGLGLFIVRELARAHDGDARYEQGTTEQPSGAFIVEIPLA